MLVRPAYTLDGDSAVSCENKEELEIVAKRQLDISNIRQIFVEKALQIGKKLNLKLFVTRWVTALVCAVWKILTL